MMHLLLTILLLGAGGPGGRPAPAATPQPHRYTVAYEPENQDDPSYKMYKAGYDLVLDERWKEAYEKLHEMIAKYPKSEYRDRAEYWSAYALSHYDRKEALVKYKEFVKNYPSSRYYDDAVADLNGLDMTAVVTSSGVTHVMTEGTPTGYAYSTGTSMAQANRALRRAMRGMTLMRVPSPAAAPRLAPGLMPGEEGELDTESRLKMDALSALGESKEDSVSFKTLREVALDRKQQRILRQTAMDALLDFKKFDVLPVFVEIAKQDTSEDMQDAAISYIGQLSHDKNRSVETLSELFYAIPAYRMDQRLNVLGSIAEIGNDRAVEVLGKVARTNDRYEIRSEAVYYLGSIGSDKARSVLYELLRSK